MSGLRVSPDLTLPLDTVTSTLVVYGGKGMGKTNFGAVLVEELHVAGLRFSVLDPVGVWHGLQYSFDGKARGIEVLILGGVHGDLPILPTAGAVVADLVADEEVDTVIDISRRADGRMWTVGERIRFVADYCSRLYERQGERRRPLMQVIDEAGRYVPQAIPAGALDIARCVGAIEQLVELGRNVGVGVTLITQRSARMNKSVSELADCMIAFRTVGPRSIDAVLDWFGEHVPKDRWRGLVEQLRALPVGTALVVSPGWLAFEGTALMRARDTFDSSATPKPGQRERRATGEAAKPNLTAYRERMAATIEKAAADDPKALRARVAELEKQLGTAHRELRAKPTAAAKVERVVETVVERVEVPIVTDEQIARLVEATDALRELARHIIDAADSVTRNLVDARPLPQPTPVYPAITPSVKTASVESSVASHAQLERARRRDSSVADSARNIAVAPSPGELKLSKAERSILTALAQYPQGRSKVQVAVLTGYAVGGGGFGNALSSLRTRNLIVGRDPLLVTAEGLETLGSSWEPLPTGRALLEHWIGQLGKAERLILQALADEWPRTLSKQEVAERTGYAAEGGGFGNALSRLRTLELIAGRGELRASDALFQEAGRV